MATYISLISFTEQGVREFRQSPQRASAFNSAAQKAGLRVSQVYWTLGGYDGVLIFDAPDEQAATAAMLGLGAGGNVRTQTLRAFTADEFEAIVAQVP
jgi:uncharacterized protein with GYD domain